MNMCLLQNLEVIRGAWNTVKLDEPYTITGDSLYVGVGRHGTIGIMFSDDTYVFDASWQRAMGKDDSDPEKRFLPGEWVLPCPKDQAHPLPLRLRIFQQHCQEIPPAFSGSYHAGTDRLRLI